MGRGGRSRNPKRPETVRTRRGKRAVTRGQTLVEVLVALGVFVLIVSSTIFLILDAYSANRQGAERTIAAQYSHAGLEAVKSLKNRRFGNLVLGSHGVTAASGRWEFQGAADALGKFTRTVTVAVAERDGAGNLVESGGTPDPDTRRVASRVTWSFTPLRPGVVEFVTFFTNWRSQKLVETTQAEFDEGTKTNVRTTSVNGGEVRLETVPVSGAYGNTFRVTGLTSIGAMTKSSNLTALRFTAQGSGVVASVRLYFDNVKTTAGNPTFRVGIQDDAAGAPNGIWLDQTGSGAISVAGWRTVTFTASSAALQAGRTYYIVVEPLNANNNRNASIRATTPLNTILPSGGVNPSANTLFTTNGGSNWSTVGAQPVYALSFTNGSTEGDPYTAHLEPMIFGPAAIGEEFTPTSTVVVGSIAASVKRVGAPADDLIVTVEDVSGGTTIEQGTFATKSSTSPSYSEITYAFLSPIQFLSGRTYRLSFRSPGSSAAAWYTVSRMGYETGDVALSTLDYGGTSSRYSASSALPTWIPVNEADIAFIFSLSSGFAPSGEFVSSVIDTGTTGTLYNYLAWNGAVPMGAALRFQIRTSNSAGSLGSEPWLGPDGTSGTFFTVPGDSIIPGPGGVRYLQYRALFTPSGLAAAVVEDVTVDFEL